MNRRIAPLVLALLAFVPACGSVPVEDAEIRLDFLKASMDGNVALGSSGGTAGTNVDINDDLGLGNATSAPLLAAAVPTAWGRVGASAFWFNDTTNGTLSSGAYGDLAAGSQVRSEFSFTNVKAWWTFDAYRSESVRISPGFALDVFDVDLDVSAAGPAQRFENLDLLAPVPMPFLDGEARFGDFFVAGQGGAMRIDLGDGLGTYWDLEGRIGYLVDDKVEFHTGYRAVGIDANGNADDRQAAVDLIVHGWFVGGSFRF
ncbi:MAG: hypothetical protein ACO3YY_12840 [Phycisphaerales bacterium]